MKLDDHFSDRLHTLDRYYTSYIALVSEYPYLKRLMIHVAILVFSLLVLILGNVPFIYRLGPVIDWLQFFGVIGLFYGVLAGSIPYLKLDATSKPYQKVIKTQQKKASRTSSSGRDLVIGTSAIVISVMILAIFMAAFETSTESQDMLIFIASLLLFLTGIYFFIKSLRLVSLMKWLFKTAKQVVSLTWWQDLYQVISNSSFTISFDRRNRIERLQDEFTECAEAKACPTETTYEVIRKLSQEDYLIISVVKKPELFVQFHKMTGHIRLELPLTKSKENKQKLEQAIKILKSHNVLKGFWLGQLQLNPNSYYYLGTWTDANETVTGDLLAIICKNNLIEATELGLALLTDVHKWNGKTKLNYTVNTFNDGWWHNL